MERGGLAGAVFNAAKETTFEAFMQRQISFTDMAVFVEHTLETSGLRGNLKTATIELDTVLAADRAARRITNEAIALKKAS